MSQVGSSLDDAELEVPCERWEIPWLHNLLSEVGLNEDATLRTVQALEEELYVGKRPFLIVELFAPLVDEVLMRLECAQGSLPVARESVRSVGAFDRMLLLALDEHSHSPWHHNGDENPLESTSFFELALELKLLVLRSLGELFLADTPALALALPQSERPCGCDALGDSYWYFGSTRLYRYTHAEDAPTQWQLLCAHAAQWEHELSLLASSTHPDELALHHALHALLQRAVHAHLERAQLSSLGESTTRLRRRTREEDEAIDIEALDDDDDEEDDEDEDDDEETLRLGEGVKSVYGVFGPPTKRARYDESTYAVSDVPEERTLEEMTSVELRAEWQRLEDEVAQLRAHIARLETLKRTRALVHDAGGSHVEPEPSAFARALFDTDARTNVGQSAPPPLDDADFLGRESDSDKPRTPQRYTNATLFGSVEHEDYF